METSRIRNVVFLGPHGVGKTTLAESLLYDMGALSSRGKIEAGNTTMDFEAEEHQRQMSLGSSVACGTWREHIVNLIDTPGASDFMIDTRFAMGAADAAVLVVSALRGIDSNSRKLAAYAREQGLPLAIFVNGEDLEQAKDFAEILQQVQDSIDRHAVLLEVPIGKGAGFKGDIDLIGMRAWYFAPDTGTVSEQEAPGELNDAIQRYHTSLVEELAENHDEMLERYLGGEEPSIPELRSTLRQDFLAGKIIPILFGSAHTNLGVRPLMDLIVDLFPSPADRSYAPVKDADTGEAVAIAPTVEGTLVAHVFKTFSDPYVGKISILRVLSGQMTSEMALFDATRGEAERAGRLYKLVGKKQIPVDQLGAGEIGAVAKLKDALTGDTLVAGGHHPRNLQVSTPRVPPAIWSVAIAAASKNDEAKLAISLGKLKEEDPALQVSVEPRTHKTVLAGHGQAHLEVTLAKLKNRFHIEVLQSEPQVPYRETITGSAQGQGRHKKQTGGRGQFGDVWLKIEPLARDSGFEFVDAVVGGSVPRNYIPAVEKGVRETLERGIVAGYPIVDVRVTLFDGSYHQVDSSEMAFKTAAHLAMKKIFVNAQPMLLEPIMDIALTLPDEFMGDAMSDLSTRRAQIEGMDGGVIRARIPLAELAGLVAEVQSFTKGQGSIESSFHGYAEVPLHLQNKLISELKAEAEEVEA